KSWRRLNGHPSVTAEPNFVPKVAGQPLMIRAPKEKPQPLQIGSDGIAIGADGRWLYYCPLASRHLYRVDAAALADEKQGDEAVAATVQDLGDRGFASDGLETDAQDRIYLTDYENN